MKRLIFLTATILLLFGCSGSPYLIKHRGKEIVFYVKISNARSVYLVSSATNFKRARAVKVKNGLWKAVIPYKNGLIKYFYVVNGRIFTPPCKTYQYDDFGGKDCVYIPKV